MISLGFLFYLPPVLSSFASQLSWNPKIISSMLPVLPMLPQDAQYLGLIKKLEISSIFSSSIVTSGQEVVGRSPQSQHASIISIVNTKMLQGRAMLLQRSSGV